jgi:hypothetical protein
VNCYQLGRTELVQSAYLVVDVLKDTNQASWQSNSVVRVGGFPLGHVVVLFSHDLLNNISTVLEQDTDQLVVLLSACDPRVLRHGDEILRVIETSGNEGEVNTDLLVRCAGNLEELLESSNGLCSVGVLDD